MKTRHRISVILILLAAFTATACGGARESRVPVRNGAIDITSHDPARGIIRLDGKWEFHWKKLYTAEDFRSGKAGAPLFVQVPSPWNGTVVDGGTIDGFGYATYRLRVTMPWSDALMGLKIIDTGTAYRLYVGDDMVASNGKVSDSETTYRPEYRPMSVAFPLKEGYRRGNLAQFDIILQVSNWEHNKGGPWESIRLGTYEDIRDARENRMLMEIFLAGVIAIMMIYHIGLFISNRENKSTIYFALMALMLLLRTVITSERVLHMLLPGMNWTLALKIEYITGFCSTTFIILFMDHIFREHVPRRVNMAVIGAGALIFLIIAAAPPWFFTRIKNAFQIYLVVAGLYAVGVLAFISFRRVKGAFVAFLGFTVLFFSGINDILYSDLVINTMYLAPVGLFFFILSQSYLLSATFSQSFETARAEAEKNRAQNEVITKQNDFIRNVVHEASSSILSSARTISSAIESFRDNERDQAGYTREVASSVDDISAGTGLIVQSTDGQNEDLMRLDTAIRELAGLINATGAEVSQALDAVQRISNDAREGNRAMETMSRGISNIFESSAQVNGIIQIINDISDRINLLSLNAAIEAARAGDSGRGFAVVADEISKLADQTATSIKEIDRLIKTNEGEIRAGAGNISRAVESVSAIISNIEIINGRISTISDLMRRQLGLNASITGGAGTVREGSDRIKTAMDEQRNGIEEISATMEIISGISQRNASTIEEISEAARSLLEMMDRFNRDIEKYEG